MDFEGLLSVVIPVYRSETYLEQTVAEYLSFFDRRCRLEIILVNDASPDGAQRVIEHLSKGDARIRYLELGNNSGQHAAILRGFSLVRGDWVVTVDDDGQNPPEAAWGVVEALRAKNLDIVYGRFESTEQSAFRVAASRVNRWVSAHTLGNRGGISVTNVRAIRGNLARALGNAQAVYPYIDALVFRATRRIGEVRVAQRPRLEGRSTYTLAKLLRLSFAHFTTLTALPLKLAAFGSFLASMLGLSVGVFQLLRTLAERRAPPGWLSLFCAVSFFFALLFVFLGVISLYLSRMYISQNERGLDWVRSQSSDGTMEAKSPNVASVRDSP